MIAVGAAAVQPNALLGVEHRASTVELDDDGEKTEDGRENEEADRGEHDVETALEPGIDPVGRGRAAVFLALNVRR
jgi:hypothetical protein